MRYRGRTDRSEAEGAVTRRKGLLLAGAGAPPALPGGLRGGRRGAGPPRAWHSGGGPDAAPRRSPCSGCTARTRPPTTRPATSSWRPSSRPRGFRWSARPSPTSQAKLQAAFAAGTPPDLYFTRVTTLSGEVALKQAQALDDFVRRDRFPLTDFYPTSHEQYRVAGKLHALPFDFPNRAFFANMNAFQEAGIKAPPTTYKDESWTWAAFRSAIEGLQRRFGPQGAFAVDVGRDPVRSWIAWVWNNGGDLLSRDGREVVLNQPAGVEALAFLQDLTHRSRVAPPNDQRGNVRQNFVQGKLFLYESGQPDVGALRREVGQSFTWDVVPLPKGKGPRTASGGGSAFAIGSAAQREEAWALLKHIMTHRCRRSSCAPPGPWWG